jgi:dienelactone hydrolase
MDYMPGVEKVWRRWEPRFIAAGVDYNLALKLKAEIQDWTQWCRKWSEMAADLEAFGDEAMERGHTLTAAESWRSASMLYHFGGMYYINDMDQFYQSHQKKLFTYSKAAPLLNPPAIPFEVPYEGVKLRGYIHLPEGVEKAPVLISLSGFEGVKEEGGQRRSAFLERGIGLVNWDIPGRGETWEHLPMTGEVGPPTAAIIDYLETRVDIDAGRIGITGTNRGAFLGIRAAAHDPRVKVLAVTSPGYDRRDTKWDDPYEVAFVCHLFHLDTEEQLRQRLPGKKDFTLEGCAGRIQCPVLIIAGGQDEGGHYAGSLQFYNELQGPKEWVVFPDAERNGNNVPYKVRPRLADFVADHFDTLR